MKKWISVEDDLPEYDTPVLTWNIDYKDCIKPLMLVSTEEGWLWAGLATTWDINNPECYEVDDDYECTHWQPMPKLPRGKRC